MNNTKFDMSHAQLIVDEQELDQSMDVNLVCATNTKRIHMLKCYMEDMNF